MPVRYHGTPLTGANQLSRMVDHDFCVSFYRPDSAAWCFDHARSVMWDNGAFSAYTRKTSIDENALYAWLEPLLQPPHWAVVLDIIGGSVEAQKEALRRWPFARQLSKPVWHLDKPLSYLDELLTGDWSGVCLGSAGQYWQVGSDLWRRRMDEVFNYLANRGRVPWLHGMRMLSQLEHWPLTSADSTNVAQNFRRDTGCAWCKANSLLKKRRAQKVALADWGAEDPLIAEMLS